MGTLFPDSPEYPDHTPIPSPLDAPVGTLVLTAYIGLVPLCPIVTLHTDDAPHADHAPQSMVVLTSPASSTGVTLTGVAATASAGTLTPTLNVRS